MAIQIYLEIYNSDGSVAELKDFDRDTIKIGRLSSAQVRLEDTKVGRIHAVIEVGASADSVSIQDMGSASGTLVNSNKINKCKLNNGDTLQLGDTKIVVYIGNPPQAAAAQPAAMPQQPMAPQAGMIPPQYAMPQQPMAQQVPQFQQQPAFGQMPNMGQQPSFGQPQPMAAQVAAPQQPASNNLNQIRFDSNEQARTVDNDLTQQRISTSKLGKAAIEQKAHPALPPEDRMTPENMSLEMRVYWGQILLDIRHYHKVPKISIGEAKGKVDVFITAEQLPAPSYPIIRYMDEQYILTFHECMEGEFDYGDGNSRKLEDLKRSTKVKADDALSGSYQLPLTPETKGIIHYAGMTFAFRFVSPPKMVKSSPWSSVDVNFINLMSMSFAFHLAFIIMAYVYPFDVQDLKENLFTEPDRFAKLIVTPPEVNKSSEDLLKKMQEKAKKEQEELKKKKEEKPKEQPKEQKVVNKTVTKQEKQAKQQANVKKALDQLFSSDDDGGSLLGGGGGGSLSGTLSNVIGTMGSGSASAGLAGLGIRGSGPMTGGGVGTSRGIGGIGLLGGGGKGANYNVGVKKKVEVKVEFNSEPTISGGLTKADIRKVIHKNRNQIRYCYEQGLATNKNMEGRVMINWIINAQGNVVMASVAQSDLPVKSVEQCMVAKIKTWKFPEPKGGGIVEVNYPFIFKTS